MNQEIKPLPFPSQKAWHDWLEKNYQQIEGIWLQIYKKASKVPTVTYAEALEEALCYGWIDGIGKSYDKDSYVQKFTPRRSKSVWSKINTEHIERLTKEGRMKPSGIAVVEAAKADGRWAKAYESPKNMKVPQDFLDLLDTNPQAKAFFETLNKQNQYAIAYRLQDAKKPETRKKRKQLFFEMMMKGEKFY